MVLKEEQELLPITFVEKEIVERNKHFVWTTKHWAAKIMAKFAQKYFNETFVKDTLIDFSRAILKTFAPSFMEVFFHMLLQSKREWIK
jgi:hypothetical protein